MKTLSLALLLVACKDSDTICEPTDMACFCRERPTDPACTGADAGLDAGDIDAGPCGFCSAPTPHCNATTTDCVECTADMHCTPPEGTCSATNECIECETNADCTDPARSRCNAGMCEPCMTSADCAIAGLGVCDGTVCVECTDSEASACGGNPCTADNACSAYGTTQETCEPCDTDANCGGVPSHCVPMEYMGMARPGGYCLTGGMPPTCDRPYTITLTGRTSLSSVAGLTFCGINEATTTCEAVRALLEDATCPGGMDSECPQPSGLCRRVGALMNRCTYPCGGPVECDMSPRPGSSCDDGGAGAGDYCGG